MKLLNVRPKLGKFHRPHVKDGKWTWMLVSRSDDPRRKVPIYFSVDQQTMDANLMVTRRKQDKIWTYKLSLPLDLKNASADEIFKELGFFEEHKPQEPQEASEVQEVGFFEPQEVQEVDGNK